MGNGELFFSLRLLFQVFIFSCVTVPLKYLNKLIIQIFSSENVSGILKYDDGEFVYLRLGY